MLIKGRPALGVWTPLVLPGAGAQGPAGTSPRPSHQGPDSVCLCHGRRANAPGGGAKPGGGGRGAMCLEPWSISGTQPRSCWGGGQVGLPGSSPTTRSPWGHRAGPLCWTRAPRGPRPRWCWPGLGSAPAEGPLLLGHISSRVLGRLSSEVSDTLLPDQLISSEAD